MSSLYHILNKIPAIDKDDMQIELEELAQELIASGLIRIDTGYYANYLHYSDNHAKINLIFSIDEIIKDHLIIQSKQKLQNIYKSKKKTLSEEKINSIIANLNEDAKKLLLVSDELKYRLTRILVQSAQPIIFKWILLDKVEIFITYSHNIGDVMDMANWKSNGLNSGMQSTDGRNVCVYVSCGGDPFAENNPQQPTAGDGWAAVARMQIIAAQELGHFADIVRDAHGQQITRHSANFSCTKPTEIAKISRKNDIQRCHDLTKKLNEFGLNKIIDLDLKLKFYDAQKLSNPKVWFYRILSKYYCKKLQYLSLKNSLFFVGLFYMREKYMGLMLEAMFKDMLFNLEPIADVYMRSDKDAHEAIACAESLARVPQQVRKWGHLTTSATMGDLYKLYYKQVIPSLIENYQLYTGKNYMRNYTMYKPNIFKKFIKILGFGKKKFQFKEVRDI